MPSISTPAKAPQDVKAALPDHLAHRADLERAGALAFAGPMSDETGDHMQGIGPIIYRAQSLDDARALAENDPMHMACARTFTLRRWMINEGSLVERIDQRGFRAAPASPQNFDEILKLRCALEDMALR